MKRPAFWILLGLVSVAATAAAVHYFPLAFSIVALDITMTRERALADARAIVTRDRLGPADFRQAASFALDSETQTFIELEGGGKAAFTAMLRDGLYAAYTWRVRHFREGETNETMVRFTPDGRPYGFEETLKEDAPGAALDAAEARRRAETEAPARWKVDLAPFTLVEQGQEKRPGGRIDHTMTYERSSPVLGEGRYRLRLVVSGDRLTEVTHFVQIPEAFTRRYASMRSRNDAIGIGSVVGMVLLYVVGGIGVGLFFMLRSRYVLWRQATIWGLIVGTMQALASLNEWPLVWMTYDTAVSRTTFIAGQVATLAATLIGFSAFMALSFMAAETLTRRAFGTHPQFWRVWAKGPGSSSAILGRTVAGFLLVSVFFAYDVGLYVLATRVFGWWTPSEALLHPDVLATYVPWLSAIANSLQAGFWEECLFRAVPLAGAALIGDRFGKRTLFLVVAFAVQAAIFGAGHAPYPTQPSFARPVELIIPSIGFGLLYVYYGLLPGIVLHFAFDVVWFALPIFLSDAPGIWFQKVMVVVMTLVPLWVVFGRRWQSGAWTALAPSDRNAAWTPPAAAEPEEAAPAIAHQGIGSRMRTAWIAIGAVSFAGCVWAVAARDRVEMFTVSRVDAANVARAALAARGVTLGPQWRVMPVPDDGSGGPQEFVSVTSGDERRRQLLGKYLPDARWNVRIATFEGDVAERAEEWHVFVTRTSQVLRVEHTLPEDRPGATLDESTARTRAEAVLMQEFGLRAGSGDVQAREVSARPAKRKARTDWTFTYTDLSLPPLPQGELRIEVELAGDDVASVRRFVFVPEQWDRQRRSAETRNLIARVDSRRRLWWPPRVGRRRRRDRVEPQEVHATALLCRRRDHADPVAGVGDQCMAVRAGAVAHGDPAAHPAVDRDRRRARRARHHLEPRRTRARRSAGSPDRFRQPPRPRCVAARDCSRSLRCGAAGIGRLASNPGMGHDRLHRAGWHARAVPCHGPRAPRRFPHSRRGAPEPARQHQPHHVGLDAAACHRRRHRRAGRIPRGWRTRWIGSRRVGRGRADARGRTRRRVRDSAARRSDDDPDRARHDDGDRRADARRPASVSRSAPRRDRRRRAHGPPRLVAVPRAAPLARRFRRLGCSEMRLNTTSWRFLAATCMLVLTVPRLWQRGMFADGMTYAVVARNMALGVGDFWAPSLSDTIYSRFFEQPPLGMGLQAIAFALVGDHFAVERVFSLLMFGANAVLIAAMWRRLLPAQVPIGCRSCCGSCPRWSRGRSSTTCWRTPKPCSRAWRAMRCCGRATAGPRSPLLRGRRSPPPLSWPPP